MTFFEALVSATNQAKTMLSKSGQIISNNAKNVWLNTRINTITANIANGLG